MKPRRQPPPLALVAAGLIGFGVLAIAERSRLTIVPIGDFARGLWVGVCLGLELLGVILLVRSKAGPTS